MPIVQGFATSYSPQLHVGVERWPELAAADRQILGAKQFAVTTPPLEVEKRRAIHNRCQASIATLADSARAAELDALVVVAEDEQGLVEATSGSQMLVFTGERVPYRLANMPAASAWAYGEEAIDLPNASDLAIAVGVALANEGLDVCDVCALPDDRGIGHHVGFVDQRILAGRPLPLLPLLFNSNRLPSPAEAFRVGRVLRNAIDAASELQRVGLIAVGGLSHIIIDEALDRRLLDACARDDEDAFTSLPGDGGTPEHGHNRPWIAAAGALCGMQFQLLDYAAAYRSELGTGCAMAFATWQPEAAR